MGIGGQDCHTVGLHEASKLASNPAETDNAERPTWHADAGIIRALAPAAFASEPRFDRHAEAQRQNECDCRGGDRMPHRDRRIGEQDAPPIERLGVDRVVANAVASDQPEASVLALELSVRNFGAADQEGVVVSEGFGRELPALDRNHRPREPCVGKKRERRGSEHGSPGGVEEIGSDADLRCCPAHRLASKVFMT